MKDDSIKNIKDLEEVVKLNKVIKFKIESKEETYQWIKKMLMKFSYYKQNKKEKIIIKKYLIAITGYSESNINKLIFRKRKKGKIEVLNRTQYRFSTKYTREDIVLLAEVVNIYRGQNAYGIKKVCNNMYYLYKDDRFERLADISISHLYNLKKTSVYKKQDLTFTKTNPTTVNIGERKNLNLMVFLDI